MKRLMALAGSLSLVLFGAIPVYAAPAAPTGVVITSTSPSGTAPNEASIQVSWTASTSGSLVGHGVSVSGGGATFNPGENCVGTACKALLDGLTGGASYVATVTAINADGTQTSASSSAFLAKSVPTAPTSRNVAVAPAGAQLSWNAPASNGGLAIQEYVITGTIAGSGGSFGPISVTGANFAYTASGLEGGKVYTFSIIAKNSNGSSILADGRFDPYTTPAAPEAPNNPSTTISGRNITVTWVAPADGGSAITRYEVSLFRAGVQVDSILNGVDPALRTASFTVVANGTYTASVAARNIIGLGPRSGFSNGSTLNSGAALLDNAPIFSPTSISDLAVGAIRSIAATAPSLQSVTLLAISSPPGTCSILAGSVQALAPGVCTIRASAIATTTHNAGQSTLVFDVKRNQTISFNSIPAQSVSGTLALNSTVVNAASGLSLSFTATGTCSVAGNIVSFSGLGSCSVTASQAGNSEFFAAPSVSRSFSVVAGGSVGSGGSGALTPAPVLKVPAITKPLSAGTKVALIDADGNERSANVLVAEGGKKLKLSGSDWALDLAADSGLEVAEDGSVKLTSGSSVALSANGYKAGSIVYFYLVPVASLTTARAGSEISISALRVIDLGFTTVGGNGSFSYIAKPAGGAGDYLLQISGTNTLGKRTSIAISTSLSLPVGTGELATWTKKLDASSAKIYAKSVVGAGKVRFVLNGKEIAWVRALDASDSKLRVITQGPMAGSNYLVRTVNLVKGKKNVLEVYVDGVRITRTAYSY